MEIKAISKFEIGDIKKVKGSTNQKFLVVEIFTITCSCGTQILYHGTIYTKKDTYGLTAKAWQGTGYEKEPQEEWTAEKSIKINEIELE